MTKGGVFIGTVATVIVTVVGPSTANTIPGRIALEMTRRAGGVAFTAIHCLVGGSGVFAIVDAVVVASYSPPPNCNW